MTKFIKALARHELALTRVKALSQQIGEAVSKCPIDRQAMASDTPEHERQKLWSEGMKHTKTHLWQAFQHKEPSSCGWGEVHLRLNEVGDYIADEECPHCYLAWELIRERRDAKQELGRARMSIRALGRQAVKLVEAEQ